jgi:autotransporter translocation and assembly factor TamB
VRLRRIIRGLALGLVAAVGLLVVVLCAAVFVLQGETLAGLVRKVLPAMPGTIEVRAVHWRARALVDLLTDRPTPVTVDGLRITDPEGTRVLEVPHLSVKVRPRSAIAGKIYLHDLVVSPGSSWRFAAMHRRVGNGFLGSFSQPAPPEQPGAVAGPPAAPSKTVFQIVGARLEGLTAVFDFPGWGLELRNVHAPISLTVDGNFVGFDTEGLDARDGGYLRILTEVLPFDRIQINRVATTRDWPDEILLDVAAARTGRSTLTGKGRFTEIYGYGYRREPEAGIKLHASFTDVADALAAVAGSHGIPGLRIGGRGARLDLDLDAPFARLSIAAALTGLDVAMAAYEARGLGLRAKVVVDPLKLTLEDLSFSSPAGGRFVMAGDLAGSELAARLRFDRFATASYVPAGLRKLASGKLSGRIALSADIGEKKRVALQVAGLDFARAHTHGLPGSVRVTGHASASRDKISTSGIRIQVPGASAELRGEVQLAKKLLALGLRASTSDLPTLLTSFGVQPLARGAALSVEADGTFSDPRARGEVVLAGISIPGLPEVPRLATRFRLENGALVVDTESDQAFGGRLVGHGEMRLWQGTLSHMVRSSPLTFRLEGHDVELATLLALGWASGKVSFVATASGPLDKLRAHVEIPAGSTVQVFGAPWELRGIDVEADARTVVVRTAQLGRPSGAQIAIEGHMEFGGAMAWRVSLHDVALEGLPGLAGGAAPVTGRLSADLTAAGSLARPALSGTLDLAGVTARGVRLGDGRLVIAPLGEGGVTVKGNLFHRFDLEGSATFGARGPRVAASLSFDKLALEELLPELAALGDGRGSASGRVSLELRPEAPLTVDARLSAVEMSIIRMVTDAAGRPVPQRIWVRNDGPLHASLTGERIRLDEARLVTDGGQFRVRGELAGAEVRGGLDGHLDLDLLQPFVRRQVQKLTGDLAVELAVAGTTGHPDVRGTVAIANPVRVQPVGFATEVVIPSGKVRLTGQAVELADLALRMNGATLNLRGQARFDDRFAPTSFQLDALGEVDATLMEALAAGAITDASGRAQIKAHLGGTPAAPEVSARIDLGQIELRLRDLGRELAVESGTIELTNKELLLRNVRTRIDDQGHLLIGVAGVKPGRVEIKRLVPRPEIGQVELPLKGERLTYRVPNTVEIDDLGFNLLLTGNPADGLQLSGGVDVASGRYVQDFAVNKLVISPRISESSARPFYEGQPLLEDLALDLRVRTVGDGFYVQNNLAPELHMTLDLQVGGTLSDTRLAGAVRPTDGRFHIPGLRGDFELVPNVNYVSFVETKSIRDGETPELNLEAQNLVTDSTGNEHNVRMRIRGPIGQAAIDLSSDDGLDRNQALVLLFSGRTTEDATRFGTTGNATLGSNFRSGTDMVGQLSRDTVANLVEPYIDDTLQLLTGQSINLRPTVGADGFELKLIWRTTRKMDFQLSFLRGFQSDSQQRYRGEFRMWLLDYLTARTFYQRLTLSPQQGISEDISSGNLELTFDFPLRLWRP